MISQIIAMIIRQQVNTLVVDDATALHMIDWYPKWENGKYYSQTGTLYKCVRDTGNPVYHPLSDLVEIYVEVDNV